MLYVLDANTDLFTGGEHQVKVVSSQEKPEWNWLWVGVQLRGGDIERWRLFVADGKWDRQALGHGKRQGIAISVKPRHLHMICADPDVDLRLGKANDGEQASEERQSEEKQSEQTDRSE